MGGVGVKRRLGNGIDCVVMNFEMLRFCICREELLDMGVSDMYLSGRGVTTCMFEEKGEMDVDYKTRLLETSLVNFLSQRFT